MVSSGRVTDGRGGVSEGKRELSEGGSMSLTVADFEAGDKAESGIKSQERS